MGSSTVTVNGIAATNIEKWSATAVDVEVPIGATTGNVIVKVGGVNSNSVGVTIVPAPSITGLSVSSGPIGTSVTVTGTNINPSLQYGGSAVGGPGVSFFPTGGCPFCTATISPSSNTNTSMVITVPAGAITGKLAAVWDGIRGNPFAFTVTGTLAPVALAGLRDVVPLGSTVRLDGTHSYDLNGLSLTYQWSFSSIPSGSHAVLINPATPFPTFVADVAGEYVVSLVVNNGTQSSATTTLSKVSIDTPTAFNNYPIANAGPDQTVSTGATVQLDGSASMNPGGEPISYIWCLWYAPNDTSQLTYKGLASISNPTVVNPTFVASSAGSYFATLTVSSLGGCTAFDPPGVNGATPSGDAVKISTVNSQPVANASPAQSIQAPQTVQLDGTGSTDVDGNVLTYTWSLVSKPTGSAATISSAGYPQPTFNADIVGTYVAQLIVKDGTVNSLPGLSGEPIVSTSTVTITNLDVTPVANAGPAQTAPGGKHSKPGRNSVIGRRWT